MNINRTSTMIFLAFVLIISACTTAVNERKDDLYIMDMVHNNPAEGKTETSFNNPEKLKEYGYNGMVLNDFKFVHATISYDSFDSTIFPTGSPDRDWIDTASANLEKRIEDCHNAGIEAYCFMDIVVLPKKLVEKYKSQLCDENGRITFEKPLTEEIHRIMIREIFHRYPNLDGLVIRTGETYLHNVPYHTGNNPILNGPESHIKILNILRDEVALKQDKKLFYRTWDFGFFHVDPDYYLKVTNAIEPHRNLVFSIKHTEGDYHRTFPFNPTLGIGKHKQIVEVQCQREYEGKGAHPNYVMDGVINGFEEYKNSDGMKGLNDLKNSPLFAGVWSWSRGGGWVGPYITNELWCDLNAYVISAWVANPDIPEEEIFFQYAKKLGLSGEDQEKFHELCLLSAKGVLRGHNSLVHTVNVWWTRDQFMGGTDLLGESFSEIIHSAKVEEVLKEKDECVRIWEKICELASQIKPEDPETGEFIKVSSEYGLLKYSIIRAGWTIILKGMEGEQSGQMENEIIAQAIEEYDSLWNEFRMLKENNPSCASLYKPFSFVFEPPLYHEDQGIKQSVDHFRKYTGYAGVSENKE